jgi:hypothetical protein
MTNGNTGNGKYSESPARRRLNGGGKHVKQDEAVTAAIDTVIHRQELVRTLAEMEHEMLRMDFHLELDKHFKKTREGRLLGTMFKDTELTGFFNGRIGFQFNRGLCGGFLDIPPKAAARLQQLVDEMAEQKRIIKLTEGNGKAYRRETLRKALEGNPAAVRLVQKAVEHVLTAAAVH